MESFSWQHYLLTFIAFTLIFSANAYVPVFYATTLFSVLGAFVFADIRSQLPNLNKQEKWFLISFLTYAIYGATNMLVHGYWEWSTFNYPVKFSLVIGLYFAIRKYGITNMAMMIGASLGLIAATLWAFYQSEFLNIYRVYGSTSEFISAFGLIALWTGFMTIAYLLNCSLQKPIKLAAIAMASTCTLYAVLETGTKGVWITIPALIALLFIPEHQLSSRRVATYALVVLSLPILLYFESNTFHTRINEILEPIAIYINTGIPTDGSATIRLETWKATWIMFMENPLIGIGVDNFISFKAHLIETGSIRPYASHPAGPHNDFIGSLGTKGLLGLLTTIMVYICFALLLWQHRKSSRWIFLSGLALIIMMAISGLTGDRLDANLTVTYYAVMAALLAGQSSYLHLKQG